MLSSTAQDTLCLEITEEESLRITLLSPSTKWHSGETYLAHVKTDQDLLLLKSLSWLPRALSIKSTLCWDPQGSLPTRLLTIPPRATPASSMLLQGAEHIPTSGPLHMLFPFSEQPSPTTCLCLLLCLFFSTLHKLSEVLLLVSRLSSVSDSSDSCALPQARASQSVGTQEVLNKHALTDKEPPSYRGGNRGPGRPPMCPWRQALPPWVSKPRMYQVYLQAGDASSPTSV